MAIVHSLPFDIYLLVKGCNMAHLFQAAQAGSRTKNEVLATAGSIVGRYRKLN